MDGMEAFMYDMFKELHDDGGLCYWLKQVSGDFFGTRMIVVFLKQVGTTAWAKEMLKISVNTSVS